MRYQITVDPDALVEDCRRALEAAAFPAPKIVVQTGDFVVHRYRFTLYEAEPQEWESAKGQVVREQQVRMAEATYPIPNLVARAAQATGLTRATINRIFKALSEETKQKIFRNPEGFAGTFTTTVREVLAKHVTDRLTFALDGEQADLDLEELFPAERSFPQKELLDAGPAGLYDRVQEDSGVEKAFVARLRQDDAVILYFKFPPSFKVRLPKLIGNYNPDWGIVRRTEDGRVTLHLVRETKGSERIEQLQWTSERRKIECAEKYFAAAGVDYRPITAETVEWWRPWEVARTQQEFGLEAGKAK